VCRGRFCCYWTQKWWCDVVVVVFVVVDVMVVLRRGSRVGRRCRIPFP
jgi:hypothetical protein